MSERFPRGGELTTAAVLRAFWENVRLAGNKAGHFPTTASSGVRRHHLLQTAEIGSALDIVSATKFADNLPHDTPFGMRRGEGYFAYFPHQLRIRLDLTITQHTVVVRPEPGSHHTGLPPGIASWASETSITKALRDPQAPEPDDPTLLPLIVEQVETRQVHFPGGSFAQTDTSTKQVTDPEEQWGLLSGTILPLALDALWRSSHQIPPTPVEGLMQGDAGEALAWSNLVTTARYPDRLAS